MKTSHKKEGAEDLAKIVEAEEIKEKDRAIYGEKMTTMLAMIVDLKKPVCIRTPPPISRKIRSIVVDDSEILSPHPFLLEEFPDVETSTDTASQSTVLARILPRSGILQSEFPKNSQLTLSGFKNS